MFFHSIPCALNTVPAETLLWPFPCRSLCLQLLPQDSPSPCSHWWAWTWQLWLGSLMLLLDHSLPFLSKIICFDSLIMNTHTYHQLLAAAVFRPLAGLNPSWHTVCCLTFFLFWFLGFQNSQRLPDVLSLTTWASPRLRDKYSLWCHFLHSPGSSITPSLPLFVIPAGNPYLAHQPSGTHSSLAGLITVIMILAQALSHSSTYSNTIHSLSLFLNHQTSNTPLPHV